MATVHISLPDPLQEWVDAQARDGRYGSAGDYIRELIERDQQRTDRLAELQLLITEGLESGVSPHSPAELLAAARRQAAAARSRDV
jgi:antitoxin ParD1/3/4